MIRKRASGICHCKGCHLRQYLICWRSGKRASSNGKRSGSVNHVKSFVVEVWRVVDGKSGIIKSQCVRPACVIGNHFVVSLCP